MPRPARPWFRFYVEAFNDRKLLRLTPAQRWVWVAVLGAARESPTPGTLLIAEGVPMTRAELARYAATPVRDVDKALAVMAELHMVEDRPPLVVLNWGDRQYESDNPTERVRRHRSNADETPMKRYNAVSVTAVVTDQRQRQRQRQSTETEKDLAPAVRARDGLWDALVFCWNIDPDQLTKTERGRLNVCAKQLRNIDAAADEIPYRRAEYRRRYPDAADTPMAVVGRWSELRTSNNGAGPKVGKSLSALSEVVFDA